MRPRELIEDFAAFLSEKAKAVHQNALANQTISLPNQDWLMEEIGELLDKENWDEKDVAKLSSLFFFLMVRK